MTFIEACRAYCKTSGSLPCQISILIEGEDDIRLSQQKIAFVLSKLEPNITPTFTIE